jgi:hypothetical protein
MGGGGGGGGRGGGRVEMVLLPFEVVAMGGMTEGVVGVEVIEVGGDIGMTGIGSLATGSVGKLVEPLLIGIG